MKTTKFLFCLLVFAMTGFVSCGGDDVNCDSVNFSIELEAEIDAITSASIAYASDPSASNCQAFKDAYSAYLDAIEPYGDCALSAADEQEFNNQIAAAQAAIDQLQC